MADAQRGPDGLRGFPNWELIVQALRTAVADSSLRYVAAQVMCSPTNLSEFLDGSSAPVPRMANSYLAWYLRDGRGSTLRDVATWVVLRYVDQARRDALGRYLDSATGAIPDSVPPPEDAGIDEDSRHWAAIRATLAMDAERTSLRRVAEDVGMSPTGLQEFIGGAAPRTKTRERLESWYERRKGSGVSDVGAVLTLAITRLLEFVNETSRAEVERVIRDALRDSGINLDLGSS